MIQAIFLTLGTVWIATNIFFLPFHPWTEGFYRSWLILKGLVPYKDFLWVREPLDITLLAGIHKIFGLNILNYQYIMFFLFLLISLILFYFLKKKSLSLALASYAFYIVFLFPLFSNAEIEESLVGLFSLLTLFSLWHFTEKKQSLFIAAAGIFSGFAIVTKFTSAVVAGVSFVFLALLLRERPRKLLVYIFSVATPIGIVCLLLAIQGALGAFISDLIFTLTLYREWLKPWGLIEGMRMAGLYLAILFPYVTVSSTKLLTPKVHILLFQLIFGLFMMLFASFWSYRLVASFPLLSIAAGIVLLEVYKLFQKRSGIGAKGLVVISFLVFVGLFWQFGYDYVRFVSDNGISYGQYLLDFGENELNAAVWLRNNTTSDTKVFNMSNNIILVHADRLPHNRYIGGMPVEYLPFEKTALEMESNPPRVVVFQERLLEDWPELYGWPFLDFLKKRYILKQQFGDIQIYFLDNFIPQKRASI